MAKRYTKSCKYSLFKGASNKCNKAQFALFEQLKSVLNKNFGESPVWSFAAGICVFRAYQANKCSIGGIGTLIAWIVAYPQDMIKTRVQVSATRLSIAECSREIYNKGGLPGFFKGLSPCLLRAVVTGATRYVVYEKLQALIGGDKY